MGASLRSTMRRCWPQGVDGDGRTALCARALLPRLCGPRHFASLGIDGVRLYAVSRHPGVGPRPLRGLYRATALAVQVRGVRPSRNPRSEVVGCSSGEAGAVSADCNAHARVRIGEILRGARDGQRLVVVTVAADDSDDGAVDALTLTADQARKLAAALLRGAESLEKDATP